MRSNLSFVVGLLVVPFILIALSLAGADEFEVPNTFMPRTPARADEVNENFAALGEAFDEHASLLEGLMRERRFVSIAAFTMQPVDSTIAYSGQQGVLTTWTDSQIRDTVYLGHVSLPDGARVRGVWAEGSDTDPDHELAFSLRGHMRGGAGISFHVTERAGSGVTDTPGEVKLWSPDPGSHHQVDNEHVSYVIHLRMPSSIRGSLNALRFAVELY